MTPATPTPLPLATAQRYARSIVEWLQPHCTRLEIAGSIRRERPYVNDVDIVCIPKTSEVKDLLGNVSDRKNFAWAFLVNYVAASQGKARFQSGGEREGKQVIVQLPKCQLDLWFADEATFATRLLCRTGSKEHNIWLCERAKALNGHWDPYEGLAINGVPLPAPTEECIYAALDLPFIEPRDREIEKLRRLERFNFIGGAERTTGKAEG